MLSSDDGLFSLGRIYRSGVIEWGKLIRNSDTRYPYKPLWLEQGDDSQTSRTFVFPLCRLSTIVIHKHLLYWGSLNHGIKTEKLNKIANTLCMVVDRYVSFI